MGYFAPTWGYGAFGYLFITSAILQLFFYSSKE
jgi:hypothetical protein